MSKILISHKTEGISEFLALTKIEEISEVEKAIFIEDNNRAKKFIEFISKIDEYKTLSEENKILLKKKLVLISLFRKNWFKTLVDYYYVWKTFNLEDFKKTKNENLEKLIDEYLKNIQAEWYFHKDWISDFKNILYNIFFFSDKKLELKSTNVINNLEEIEQKTEKFPEIVNNLFIEDSRRAEKFIEFLSQFSTNSDIRKKLFLASYKNCEDFYFSQIVDNYYKWNKLEIEKNIEKSLNFLKTKGFYQTELKNFKEILYIIFEIKKEEYIKETIDNTKENIENIFPQIPNIRIYAKINDWRKN